MNFTQFNLDSRLLVGIENAGYQTPTPIQIQALPVALTGRDLIGAAQTGTGKTAAFVLPILHKLLSGRRGQARALIVTPTRELADQIDGNIRTLGAGTGLSSVAIYGGVGATPQIQALEKGVEIVVACPGRLLDLIGQGYARLENVQTLVLDEADRMLDMGFLPDVRRILKSIPTQRQTMLFSATFPKEIEKLASETLKRPKHITIGISRPVYTVKHALYPVPHHLKTGLLLTMLEGMQRDSVLIFTRTRHRTRRLAKQLARAGHRVTSLHSDRTQGQRQSALQGFKGKKYQVMVATDIAARGLDIENIAYVINFDMPDTSDAYIHRIGRTGRAKRRGEAFTLVTPDDSEMVQTLEKIMGHPLERRRMDDFDYDKPNENSHSRARQPGHGAPPARGIQKGNSQTTKPSHPGKLRNKRR